MAFAKRGEQSKALAMLFAEKLKEIQSDLDIIAARP